MKYITYLLVCLYVLFPLNLALGAFSSEFDINLDTRDKIAEYIVIHAMAIGYSPHKALAIAECESSLNPKEKNKTSTATGIFQFLTGTWIATMTEMRLPTTTDRTDPKANIDAGLFWIEKHSDKHWSSSRSCWQPKVLELLVDST